MNWLTPTLLFLAAWLAVFAQTQFHVLHSLTGTPVGILPALIIYSALSHSLPMTTLFAIVCGLWMDCLSPARLGVSVMPMFLLGFFVHIRQHLLLRDQVYAQFWLGLGAGIGVPLTTLCILNIGGKEIIVGWGTLWQLIVSGLINGLFGPLWFLFFDKLRQTFEYQPISTPPFRPDRQIKYGRH